MTRSNAAAEARRELAEHLEMTAERTPTAACALKSLLAMTVGATLQRGGGEEKRLLELAFAVSMRAEAAARRSLDALYARGEPRAMLIAVLQLAVLMSDGPALTLAAEMLARFDALSEGHREADPAARFARNPAELAPRRRNPILA